MNRAAASAILRHPRRALLRWLVLLALALAPGLASARCGLLLFESAAPVNFTVAASIAVPFNAPVGAVLVTTPLVTPRSTSTLLCLGTTAYGVVDSLGSTPGSSATVYPTNVPGVGYSITHDDLSTYLRPYPCCQLGAGTYNASIPSSLQLIKTGPIANGARLAAGQLGYWQFEGNLKVEIFNLANAVTFTVSTCQVTSPNIDVTLPPVSVHAFGGVGSTAGATPFAIPLTCAAGATLSIELDTASPQSGATGVIRPGGGQGQAGNVGVQLVDSALQPVALARATVVGATAEGAMNLTYYARYYQTGATVSAGSVSATATFTLSYQ